MNENLNENVNQNVENLHGGLQGNPGVNALTPESAFEHPVVRMRNPADMVDALPYLLGFFPSDSLSSPSVQISGASAGAPSCGRHG